MATLLLPSLFLFANLCFVVVNSQPVSTTWHAYDQDQVKKLSKNSTCQRFWKSTRYQPSFGLRDNTAPSSGVKGIRLWPGLVSSEEEPEVEKVFAFDEAMEIIWKHQNPPNCSTAKYLIISTYKSGFGSTIHVEASMLSTAMKLGRVLIKNTAGEEKYRPGGFLFFKKKYMSQPVHEWMINNELCRSQKKADLECYYEPLSKCTIHDAMRSNAGDVVEMKKIVHVGDILIGDEERIRKKYEGHRTIRSESFPRQGMGHFSVPTQFSGILACLPMNQSHWFYWWRAVSASYYVRPNTATLKALEKHRTLPIKIKGTNSYRNQSAALTVPDENNGQCISIYVRRGDKAIEMKLVPFERYTDAVNIVMSRYLNTTKPTVPGTKGKPAIFIGSESTAVINEAIAWGKKNDFQVLFTNIINRDSLSAAGPVKKSGNHPDEYLSMLLNLEYSLKCDAFIGTLASNWCRLVDEMRATVGTGAQKPYIDLSTETCGKEMCINEGVKDFQW